jgi:CheY-like chemotaxis protein
MDKIRVMMVDDEPLIRKVVKMEMNSRDVSVESGDVDGSVMRRVEMVETFADGPSLLAALEGGTPPDYLLVDMEFQGEPTGGLMITRRIHERYPSVRVIIFSGRFDNPEEGSQPEAEGRLHRVHEIGRVVMEALALGASAFVSKNAAGGFSVENILRAIACLERGERCYFNYPVMLTLKEAAESYFAIVADHDPDFALSDKERESLENAAALLEAITALVEEELGIAVDRASFDYARFATHLQYLIDRVAAAAPIETQNQQLFDEVATSFPQVARCAEKASALIEERLGGELTQEEQLYLMLHVNRISERVRKAGRER